MRTYAIHMTRAEAEVTVKALEALSEGLRVMDPERVTADNLADYIRSEVMV